MEYPCKSKNDCKDFGYVCQKNSCQCEQWYVPDKEKGVCLGGKVFQFRNGFLN